MKRLIAPYRHGAVWLRPIEESDLPLTLGWRNDDSARSRFKDSRILSWTQHRAWFERYQLKENDFLFMVEANGIRVGQVSAYSIDAAARTAEVGRFLAAPEHAGRGHMRSACSGLIQMCWSLFGLEYLFLEVFEDNQRALALYLSLGFEYEGSAGALQRLGLTRIAERRSRAA